MISTEYVREMAQYNAWQNSGLIASLDLMSDAERTRPRGAFFGSIFGTANHLLWADRFWMSRLAEWVPPDVPIDDSPTLEPTFAAWKAARERVDGRLVHWATTLRPAQLRGNLSWFSGVLGREVTKPIALCVTHMFNHQTHHRGQIHAMLTAAGVTPGVTDLPFMPEPLLA